MKANSPHDALFRFTFGQPEHAAPLLRAVLPPNVIGELDLSTLTLRPDTRIDKRLRRHQTDVLFSVRARRREVLLGMVMEHLSRSDRWTALRVLDYGIGVWRQIVREQPRIRSLPPIVAVVIHHGRRRWTAKTAFEDLLTPMPDGDPIWRQPRFRCVVKSLVGMSPEELDGLALTLLGKLTLAALQRLPGAGPAEVRAAIRDWSTMIRRLLRSPSGREAMAALSEYALTTTVAGPEILIEIAEEHVSREAGKAMETAATKLRRQGRVEAQSRLLIRLLTARFGPIDAATERKLASASPDEADRWALRLLDAPSLEAVFAKDPGDA